MISSLTVHLCVTSNYNYIHCSDFFRRILVCLVYNILEKVVVEEEGEAILWSFTRGWYLWPSLFGEVCTGRLVICVD